MPDPRWRFDAACAAVPLPALLDILPQEAADQADRYRRVRDFIGGFCGNCAVKTECIRDALATYTEVPQGIVLGGRTPADVTRIWQAAQVIEGRGSTEAALDYYESLAAKGAKPKAEAVPAEASPIAHDTTAVEVLPAGAPQTQIPLQAA